MNRLCLRFQELTSSKLPYGFDCSEIAEDLYREGKLSGITSGKILSIIPVNHPSLFVIEYGEAVEYMYHHVYSDGEFVYDPRFNIEPMKEQDYLQLIYSINTGKKVKVQKIK